MSLAQIDSRPSGPPRAKDGADRAPELIARCGRLAPDFDEALIFGDQRAQIVGAELGVEREALIFLMISKLDAVIELEDDVGVSSDEGR
jgi:hypothetical protein